MPSTLRKDNNTIAYTRWEAVDSEDAEQRSNGGGGGLPFHEFQEEPPQVSINSSNGSSRTGSSPLDSSREQQQQRPKRSWGSNNGNNNGNISTVSGGVARRGSRGGVVPNLCWVYSVKGLYILIVFGLGWIFGFLVRWGVHKYYIDPMGHCEAPLQYRYSAEFAKLSIDVVNVTSIRNFFEDFTDDKGGGGVVGHPVGSRESFNFALKVSNLWREYGMPKVEVETVTVKVPEQARIPTEIRVMNRSWSGGGTGTGEEVLWRTQLNNGKGDAEVLYSASAIGEGRLVYGHFGRFADLNELSASINFTDSVVLLRISPSFHTGTMIRNIQSFGAKAAILFPDPFYYKLQQENGTTAGIGGITANTSISLSVKYFPGDPHSPYLGGLTNDTTPSIPVVSVSLNVARQLLKDYACAKGVPMNMTYGGLADVIATKEERDFAVSVEVVSDYVEKKLQNVIGVLPGKYEPTRYVIVGSHHDTWDQQGLSQPGIGHSVLMELARTLGVLVRFGWKPGRSIILASFDGEELGHLGSNDWLHKHSKELSSRAVAYINLDYYLLQGGARGDGGGPVAASPIFRQIMDLAAKAVPCEGAEVGSDDNGDGDVKYDDQCNLHELWLDDQVSSDGHEEGVDDGVRFKSGGSAFQNVFGISTVDIALKIPESATKVFSEDSKSKQQSQDQQPLVSAAKHYLDPQFKYSSMVAKFTLVMILQMVMTPDVPLQAIDYGRRIHDDVHDYFRERGKTLDDQAGVKVDAFFEAVTKFEIATGRFHSTYNNQSIRLEFLGHHEFSDQLMELERSFLSEMDRRTTTHPLLASPLKHVVYGPSPLNRADVRMFPRLTAAMELAEAWGTQEAWEEVRREAFFAVDALESASCVLDNHLVYTYLD